MKNRIEAENFIEHSLKGKETIAPEKALKDIKWNKVTVNHIGLSNSLLKIISIVPMMEASRHVLTLKLTKPGITNFQIALMSGIRVDDINLYEEDGKARVKDYMDKYSEQEAIDKANADKVILTELQNIKAKQAPGGSAELN